MCEMLKNKQLIKNINSILHMHPFPTQSFLRDDIVKW